MRYLPVLLIALITLSFAQQEYFQQEVNYVINVTLDDEQHSLIADEEIQYINNSPDTLDYIWFHLWPNAYKNDQTAFAGQQLKNGDLKFHFSKDEDRGYIDSLNFSAAGKLLSWEYHKDWIDVAKIELNQSLSPGDTVTITTNFFVKIPLVFSRLGHTDQHYEITQWYPKPAVYDRNGWHPMPYLNQGEFYSEFGSFDVYITLPAQYRVMATGDLVDGEAEYSWLDSLAQAGENLHQLDKKDFNRAVRKLKKKCGWNKKYIDYGPPKTIHFHQDNVHEFAWFADPNWIVRKGELWLADSARVVTLWSMYLPKNAELWENSLDYIHDSGYWYGQMYGDYPYNHISAVDGDMSAGGGMEYPNITVISKTESKDLLEFVIMHEVGHNWWYGILGSNERDYPWIDEGINTYSNLVYIDKNYGPDHPTIIIDPLQTKLGIGKNISMKWIYTYLMYYIAASRDDDQPATLTSADYTNLNYGAINYSKIGAFTYLLRQYLGEATMDSIMHQVYDEWEFKHIDGPGIESIFEANVTEDLSWYFDGVLTTSDDVDYGISISGSEIEIENHEDLAAPFELVYYNDKHDVVKSEWHDGFTNSKIIPLPDNISSVCIDPEQYMPDINKANNKAGKKRLKPVLVFDQPEYYDRELYFIPTIWGNTYNGWTPGLRMYTGFIPGYHYGIGITPMWDFNNQKPVGSISLKRTLFSHFGFNYANYKLKFSRYEGVRSGQLSFTGKLKKPVVSYPYFMVKGRIKYNHLDPAAFDPLIYDSGKYLTAVIGGELAIKHGALHKNTVTAQFTYGMLDARFLKGEVVGIYKYKFGKEAYLMSRCWAGRIFVEDKLPSQYRIYYSGGVDPEFEEPVFNRTAKNNSYNVFHDQFLSEGPALRGYLPYRYAEEGTVAFNMDLKLTKLPVILFSDLLCTGVGAGEDFGFDAGLVIKLGFLEIIMPLYQNWEREDKFVSDNTWLADRIRFMIKIPTINL